MLALAFLLGLLPQAAVFAQPARSAAVAMVTDLEGAASLVAEKRGLAILDDVVPEQRIQMEKGARMVLVFLKSGEEYVFKGPAMVLVKSAQAEAISGAKPEKRNTLFGGSGREIRISPINVNQGAVLMRGMPGEPRLTLLSLSETVTLDPWPEFRWRGMQAGTLARLQLFDDKGRQIVEREIGGDALTLPGEIRLKSGVRYRWTVSGKGPGDRRLAAHRTFRWPAWTSAGKRSACVRRPVPPSPSKSSMRHGSSRRTCATKPANTGARPLRSAPTTAACGSSPGRSERPSPSRRRALPVARFSVEHARYRQGEFRDSRLKRGAVFGHHLVGAAHGADRRGQGAAAGVLEVLPRFEQRLMADDAETAHLLYVRVRVGDDPVARNELRGDRAGVANRNRIGEDVTGVLRLRLVCQILRLNRDADLMFPAFGHLRILTAGAPDWQGKLCKP